MPRRPLDPPRGLDGLPVAEPLEQRVARAVAIVASVWFALAAAWELFGPMLAGHYASSASVGIIADNILRWKIAGPVWEYTPDKPGPSMYYCHHPWGIFWSTAAARWILGRHDYVCRIVPVVLSAMTPPLLYAIGRAIWRPAAGAAAAAAFVVLPITLAFAHFNALEVPVIAWSLLGIWGYVRLTQTGRRRYLAASLAGTLLALNADWPAFLLTSAMLGFALFRAIFSGPTWFGRVRRFERVAAWWALSVVVAAATLAFYVAMFQKSGKLDDLLSSYGVRSTGNAAPLSQVLASRRYWIELSFTPIAIALGKIAAVISLLRLVVLRREHEVVPLAVLLMATVQYVVFKQGADVHVFWPHYFGAYFALAAGALVATLAPVLAWIGARIGRIRRLAGASRLRGPAAGVAALVAMLLPIAAIARDGIPALRYARETGGRFNEKGLIIHSDGAKTAFLQHISKDLAKNAKVEMHEGMKTTWSQVWTLGGRIVAANRPVPDRARADGRAIYVADTRFLLDNLQADLASKWHVRAYGPFWQATLREAHAPIDAFAIVEREPAWWEWYLMSGTEPHREIVPDPYRTWELRTHFGQPAVTPSTPPMTLEERCIAHNIALAAGDAAKAGAILAEIEREIAPVTMGPPPPNPRVRAVFDDGTEIVGASYHEGARSLLTIVIRAGGPTEADVQLTVKSKVTARAPLSTTIPDPTEREVGLPLPIAPQRWKKGFLYADRVPIRKRPGTEEFRASFWVRGKGAPPKPAGGQRGGVLVLTLR